MPAKMTDYHEKPAAAGILVDGSGLQANSKVWRIRKDGESNFSAKKLYLSTAHSPKRGFASLAPLSGFLEAGGC